MKGAIEITWKQKNPINFTRLIKAFNKYGYVPPSPPFHAKADGIYIFDMGLNKKYVIKKQKY